MRLSLLARTNPEHNRFGSCGLAAGSVDGTPISTDVLRRLTCDATVQVHSVDRDGTVGAEQASQRLPGAAMRRRLEARDQGCAFPGCHSSARRCHAHHIRHWADGGPTIDQNMILVCSRHHHLVHDGGWRMTGPPTRLIWTAPDGRRYEHPCATAEIPHWPEYWPLLTATSPAPF
ncbi:MAG TPA: HNH endonuclease [Mycobacteriales bacterium]